MTVSWALASCLLIAAVLLLRFALGRKISARLRYALRRFSILKITR